MKQLKKIFLLSLLVTLILAGCSGVKSYKGNWHIVDSNGETGTINFSNQNATIKLGKEDKRKLKLTLVDSGTKKNVSYQTFQLDQQLYTLIFPNKKNMDEAYMILPDSEKKKTSGIILYVMNRKKAATQEDFLKVQRNNQGRAYYQMPK